MTQEEILKNNKLIAEFMGLTPNQWDNGRTYGINVTKIDDQTYAEDWVIPKYDLSWDWLMPVVEKIEGLEYEVNINGNDCYVLQPNRKGRLVVHCSKWSNLECVYQAVISTIKWHNIENNG